MKTKPLQHYVSKTTHLFWIQYCEEQIVSKVHIFKLYFFFQNGKSIMVEVATGGSTDEQLPMVLKVPHFNDHPLLCCYESYSMLGMFLSETSFKYLS